MAPKQFGFLYPIREVPHLARILNCTKPDTLLARLTEPMRHLVRHISKFMKFSATFVLILSLSTHSAACTRDLSDLLPACDIPQVDSSVNIIVVEGPTLENYISRDYEIELGPADFVPILTKFPNQTIIVFSNIRSAHYRFLEKDANLKEIWLLGSRNNPYAYDDTAYTLLTGHLPGKIIELDPNGKRDTVESNCSAPPLFCVPEQYFQINSFVEGIQRFAIPRSRERIGVNASIVIDDKYPILFMDRDLKLRASSQLKLTTIWKDRRFDDLQRHLFVPDLSRSEAGEMHR